MVTLTDLLQRGKENAISSRVLVPVLGLHDTRALTQLIEKERRAGVPICASVTEPTGYYLASDADGAEETEQVNKGGLSDRPPTPLRTNWGGWKQS